LIRFTCPSTAPELNGNVSPAVTAA
jgi:hypothetical protein